MINFIKIRKFRIFFWGNSETSFFGVKFLIRSYDVGLQKNRSIFSHPSHFLVMADASQILPLTDRVTHSMLNTEDDLV